MSPTELPPPPPPAFHPDGLPAGAPKTSGAAITSLICGVLSIFCSCITGLVGLITGIVALANIGKSNGRLKGKGLAIVGIVLSLLLPVVQFALVPAIASTNPQLRKMLDEMGGAFGSSMKLSLQGTQIAGALKAYTSENGGKLPTSLTELIENGSIDDAETQAAIQNGTWQLPSPGAALADIPVGKPIAQGGPIPAGDEQLMVEIDGTFKVVPKASKSPH